MKQLVGHAVAVLLLTVSVYGSDDEASKSPSADTLATKVASLTTSDAPRR
jgi:hypothetical protein